MMHNPLRYLPSWLLLVLLPLSIQAQPVTTHTPLEDEIAVEPISSADGAINTAEDVPEFSSAGSNNVNRWYQIEMIIFTNAGAVTSAETWPQNIALTYPDNWVELKTSDVSAAATTASPHLLLGASQQTLQQAATSLKSSGHRILFHGVWREPLPATQQAPAILLSGGKQYGVHHELEGSVKISVGKYIHLDTDLWFTRFASATDAAASNSTAMTLPVSPAKQMSLQQSASDSTAVAIQQIYVMREQRHLRSKTVHYIDHPQMGMLVTFTPVD